MRLFEKPHMTKNYLMKEMVFEVGRKHGRKLRIIALLLGAGTGRAAGPQPCHWRACGGDGAGGGRTLVGLFVERWLFFAEAEHVVSLYYGR